jgi:formylglycine-generating enzyme required for sulfatase activity
MSTIIASELTVEPILQYPRLVEVGTAFLLTVDLKPQQFGDTWAYPELEEVPIRCIINSGTLFKVEFLGEPVVIVHRYGGTYSPARFLLTPEPNSLGKNGKIRITLANRFGVPMTVLETDEIGVEQEVSEESLIALATRNVPPPHIEWLTDEFQVVEIAMTKPFDYVVGTLKIVKSRNLLKQEEKEFQINTQAQQGQQLIEWLNAGTLLEMVVIPAGKFMMGSSWRDMERSHSELPQHEVSVSTFLMGKYPITQGQWLVVAGLPQVKRELNPDPSRFKGENRPVEQVSWLETLEFCARLSRYTGREYRLPSEAEWEYACRAGTTTPFHYGKTITTDLANYNGEYPYDDAPKGEHRKQTIPIGQFPANAFGLYDMHGNVWEWCADDWHDNHSDSSRAPKDAQIRIKDNNNYEDPDSRKVLRGGSWRDIARSCRSTYRGNYFARIQYGGVGFRVVCVVQ